MTLHQHHQQISHSSQQPAVPFPLTTLGATLDLPLLPRQIAQFRGAVVEAFGQEYDLLHNHDNETESAPDSPPNIPTAYHYRYPLVHYRTWQGRATLFGVEAGVPLLREFLLRTAQLTLGGQTLPLRIHWLREQEWALHMTDQPCTYRLMDYLPFHQENYARWLSAPDSGAGSNCWKKYSSGISSGWHLLSAGACLND
ncbi:MAG TPA: hypothetical protein PKC76_18975 [Saprospiraceae bacterium]|nr:hypothetical protein [Saprospiraceae bacterium]HMP26220.1 hypothetical protein [Saprospiraceae bacterium]